MKGLHVSVLGPALVLRDGSPVRLGPSLVALLSALVIERGRVVPAPRLVELLWGPAASSGARATLRSHLSHLRRALQLGRSEDGAVVTVAGGTTVGYRLDLPSEHVDTCRFEASYAEGRRLLAEGDRAAVERGVALLADALALWRGPAFADVADRPFAVAEVARLEALRRRARYEHARGLSLLGRHAEVIGALTGAVAEDPYDEGLRYLLALALYSEQRADEAAEVCRQGLILLRRRGLEAPRLRELQRIVLRREPVGPAAPDAPAAPALPRPRMLPPDLPGFVGRQEALREGLRRLTSASGAPVPLLVTGPAGVGKTAFAVRLAHAARDRYPDGQLYVDLRGFAPSGTPMPPAEAVRLFLDALQVPPQRIPDGLDAQVGLYRSLLADRRMLVVLDNARDAEQVRPLVPGAPGCATVITSRNRLPGLVAALAAYPLPLTVLPPAEARHVLAARLGAARVAAEPDAVDALTASCGGLPLALAVVAARAATRADVSLAGLAAEVRDAGRELEALDGGDPRADVRTAFSWSYRVLSPQAARLFRLSSLHPGPLIGLSAAASLLGEPVERARAALAELVGAHLLAESGDGRFGCHDLLRAYATELAAREEPEAERHEAVHRLLDHYLQSAYAAQALLGVPREPVVVTPPRPGVTAERPADRDQALAWFTAERPALLAAVRRAADAGMDVLAWQLAWSLFPYLDLRGYWSDWADTQRTGLAAAQRCGDRAAEAHIRRSLARACFFLGDFTEANDHLWAAMELYRELGDPVGQANSHRNLAYLSEVRGDYQQALNHCRHAFRLYRAGGDEVGQARSLNGIGWYLARLGRYQRALAYCGRALALLRRLGHRQGLAATWDSLGYAYHHLGDHTRAVVCYRRAIALFREVGDRHSEADSLWHLGDTRYAQGHREAARRIWQEALDILEELGHADADAVRERLRRASQEEETPGRGETAGDEDSAECHGGGSSHPAGGAGSG